MFIEEVGETEAEFVISVFLGVYLTSHYLETCVHCDVE